MATELRKTMLGGRYGLVRRIATGGMAEIFLARQLGASGFERQVVVKLLQERHRHESRVVDMFVDEARIGGLLHHPHIVHVYDVGEHEASPFIVMEYIDGEELSALCRRGLELEAFLPAEHAVELVRQAAQGMAYFHSRTDEQAEPFRIIHRDISPSNLLVTRDGNLKIIDFGIAQSSLSRSRPQDGILPGKYHYMSPEQVRGEKVDHRSDIFSLGIVLYEITVAKRLFKGRPEEVIHKITRERIKPPTFVRRDFPPALETIVMRALERHPDDRYQSGYELAADLEDFLRESGWRSGPVRIARYLDELQGKETGVRRDELQVAGEAWVDDEGEEALDFGRSFEAMATAVVTVSDVTRRGRPPSRPRPAGPAAVAPPDPAPPQAPAPAAPLPAATLAAIDEDTLDDPPRAIPSEDTRPAFSAGELRASGSPLPTPSEGLPPPRVAFGEGMIARPPDTVLRWVILAACVVVVGVLAFVFLR